MRKKITLAYITNDQERKASYKKRKNGFIKKLNEICTLCAVKACCILYSPYETGHVVWPNPEGVHAVLERFKTISPPERIKKMVNQESYNMGRIKKSHDQLSKIHKENKRRKLELYMFQVIHGLMTLDCFDVRDVQDMNCVIDEFLRNVEVQINKFQEQNGEPTIQFAMGSSSNCVPAAGVTTMSEVEGADAGVTTTSKVETVADVEATLKSPTPLIPSFDVSTSMGICRTSDDATLHQENIYNMDYNNACNELIIHDNNNVIPNYGESDGGFPLLVDGNNTWNLQPAGYDASNNDPMSSSWGDGDTNENDEMREKI